MNYYSPLRYPGGKAKIAGFIKKIFDLNLLGDGVYVEPYAGGCSVALSLLFEEYASSIVINDFDRSIYAFWFSVLQYNERLCEMINNTPVTVEIWHQQKEIQRQKSKHDLLTLGFSTFFLNRTNRSGIINGGIIGGKNQDGNYKIDARFNKENLINRIQRIGNFKDRIKLYNLDAVDLITNIQSSLPTKSLIYFDPPYYLKGKELYVNHYKHEDHVLVSKMINGLVNRRWLVSYDSVGEISTLYKSQKSFTYDLAYSAVNATKGKEIMIYHKDLYIPKAIRPFVV